VKLIVSPEAAADLQRLRAFLADKSPAAARRAVATISNAVRTLEVFPDRGSPLEAEMRELIVPFGRSAYIVRYAHLRELDEVVILRVWHGREQRE
jgi:plasmid stabilization system protein ParE